MWRLEKQFFVKKRKKKKKKLIRINFGQEVEWALVMCSGRSKLLEKA